jgi:hypothetical protein
MLIVRRPEVHTSGFPNTAHQRGNQTRDEALEDNPSLVILPLVWNASCVWFSDLSAAPLHPWGLRSFFVSC